MADAAAFLAHVADPGRGPIAGPSLLVVAHPDDETIGCGAQLCRLEGLVVVHVTDGAPAGAVPDGFASAADYAATRTREARRALAEGGAGGAPVLHLAVADQSAAFALPTIAARLAALVEMAAPRTILTHAFEGGHPDHDAVALAVHVATAGRAGPPVVEMPFYRRDGAAMGTQRFLPRADAPETTLALTPEEAACKQRMLDAHGTQAAMLAQFHTLEERFRPAPRHDFLAPPHEPPLWYELHPFGLDGAGFRRLAAEALAQRAAA